MQLQQLLRLPKSTLNVFFYFFCFHGWSEGTCFLHLLREDYRLSLKVNFFAERGFILPLYFSIYYEGM